MRSEFTRAANVRIDSIYGVGHAALQLFSDSMAG